MLTANEINHFTWAGLHFQKQVGIFRNARINYNHFSRWDFGGKFLYQAFNTNLHGNFKNNWRVGTGATWMPFLISNNALRGGSSLRQPAGVNNWAYIQSDSRKKITVGAEIFNYWAFGKTVRRTSYDVSIRVQPLDAMTVSLGMGINHNWRKQDQFVSNATYGTIKRVIVSEVDQQTLRYTLRLNYNVTPDLTIQYYGQPFITRPIYSRFGYVSDPLNPNYDARFHRFSDREISFVNGNYEVDENTDGKPDYRFGKPDFNFVQFRSNLVARWEYKAGSELYLVWSQSNNPDAGEDLESNVQNSLFDNVLSGQARNIFLLKFTYRFLR
jgi:Domain of unknown function (DUF5916)